MLFSVVNRPLKLTNHTAFKTRDTKTQGKLIWE